MFESMLKLADAAKFAGWTFIGVAIVEAAVVLLAPNNPEIEVVRFQFLLAVLLGHAVPGIVFLVLCWYMRRNSPWAFLLMAAWSLLSTLKLGIGVIIGLSTQFSGESHYLVYALAIPLFAPVQLLLMGYVGLRAINGWEDLKRLKRLRRESAYHQNQPSAGISPPPIDIVPPPPATGIRRQGSSQPPPQLH